MTIEEFNKLQINDFISYRYRDKIIVFEIFYKGEREVRYNTIYNDWNLPNNIAFRILIDEDIYNDFHVVKDKKEIDKYRKLMIFS